MTISPSAAAASTRRLIDVGTGVISHRRDSRHTCTDYCAVCGLRCTCMCTIVSMYCARNSRTPGGSRGGMRAAYVRVVASLLPVPRYSIAH